MTTEAFVRFVPWGADHLGALLLTAISAAAVAWFARRAPKPAVLTLRIVLATALLALTASELVAAFREGDFALWRVLPLQLCDLAILLAAVGLLTRHRPTVEVLYFWAMSGTVLAMVTPDVYRAFPAREFLAFFGLHGLVVVSTVMLTFGMGLTPRRGAAMRVFGLTAVYAAIVAAFNVAFGTNFLYLMAKPANPTLLDHFGPWPVYIAVAGIVGLVLFKLLALPFERRSAPTANQAA